MPYGVSLADLATSSRSVAWPPPSCPLDAFAAADLNLSKLESRPQPELPWEYLFYLDVEANAEDPRMREAFV